LTIHNPIKVDCISFLSKFVVYSNTDDIRYKEDHVTRWRTINILSILEYYFGNTINRFTYDDIFLYNRKNIGNFLLANNKYDDLVNIFKKLEASKYNIALRSDPPLADLNVRAGRLRQLAETIFNTRSFIKIPENKIIKYPFYELPTHELITCIYNICKYFNIHEVNELASGSSLFSFMINSYRERMNHDIRFIPHEPGMNEFWGSEFSDDSLCENVKKIRCQDIDNSKALFVSWIYWDFEDEICDLMDKKKIELLIHVGEHTTGCCYDYKFFSKMEMYGYKLVVIPARMLSKLDYFLQDPYRTNNIKDNVLPCSGEEIVVGNDKFSTYSRPQSGIIIHKIRH